MPRDAFLQAELPVIDQEKMRVMHDLDGYVAALDEISRVSSLRRSIVTSQRREPELIPGRLAPRQLGSYGRECEAGDFPLELVGLQSATP